MFQRSVRPLLSVACLTAALTLTSACGDKSDAVEDPGEDGPDTSSWVTRNFLEQGEGELVGGGGVLTAGCQYRFDLYVIPDESSNVQIDSCTLTFELAGEINDRNRMTLTDPGGTSQELLPPDDESLVIEAGDFVGGSDVNGKWTLEFEDRFDCDIIESVLLDVDGTYRGP